MHRTTFGLNARANELQSSTTSGRLLPPHLVPGLSACGHLHERVYWQCGKTSSRRNCSRLSASLIPCTPVLRHPYETSREGAPCQVEQNPGQDSPSVRSSKKADSVTTTTTCSRDCTCRGPPSWTSELALRQGRRHGGTATFSLLVWYLTWTPVLCLYRRRREGTTCQVAQPPGQDSPLSV